MSLNKSIKLSDANKLAAKLVKKLVDDKLKNIRLNISNDFTDEEIRTLFLIRDGHGEDILDPWKLEEYDNCYGIDIYH